MTDRPILFSAPMVRALLAGTKTQTRRVFKGAEQAENGLWHIHSAGGGIVGVAEEDVGKQAADYLPIHAGDRLWVKETWAPLSALTHNDPGTQGLADRGFYRADVGTVDGEISRWKPSIFMPRHASRITLIVTDVRVERLQDISEADAIAEGVERAPKNDGWWKSQTSGKLCPTARDAYGDLWNHINRPGAWEANPWVVAYTFTVHRGNIDQIGGAT